MKEIFKNILVILSRQEKKSLARLAILDVLISILDIVFLVALLFVINFYTLGVSPSSTYNFPLLKENPLLLISGFVLLFSIKNLLGFLVFRAQYDFVYRVASRISADNLMRYLDGSYHDYVNIDSSVYIRKISQQPIEFCHYVLNGMQQIFSQLILIFITVVVILLYNPVLFPLLLLVLVPPIFLIAFFMKRKLASVRMHGKTTSEKTIQHLQEALSGFVESNVYERNDFFTRRYHSFQAKLNHYLAEKQVIQNMPSRLIEVFAVFGLFFLILLNSFTSDTNTVPIITIAAFMAAAYKMIPGIVRIMNTAGQVRTYAFTVTDLLKENPVSDRKSGSTGPLRSIEFEKVEFSYPQKTVLKCFNLKVEKGDLVGVSGASGSGKTTIANLLLGFLSPAAGTIFINGKITGASERQAAWHKISYIKQQPFFIHDSVLKNICLQDLLYDNDKLRRVITVTGVDKLFDPGDDISEIIVTENGKNFSGGQRQRLIFSRALYKDFDLLILDEPFNELDETSEKAMLVHLQQIAAEGKMVILITHNEEALSYCNKKIVLNGDGE